ncbi:MAG TPA: rhodanese-like domain-containing protein [Nitrospirota bacterium]
MIEHRFSGPHRVVMLFSVLLLLSLSGCATGITRDELLRQMQEGTAPLIVDVRSQGEYDRDHVPGAVRIPFYSVGSGLKDMGYSKNNPIVLYCEHGPRAGIAGFTLFLSGYDKVFSLEGHMRGWRENDFPVEVITH